MAHSRRHPLYRPLRLRQMHEQKTAVDQVIVRLLKLVVEDVVVTDFDIGRSEFAQEARIEVCGHDLSLWANLLGQPARHRAVAGPNLQAAPALPHAEAVQTAKRDRVCHALKQPQALAFKCLSAVTCDIVIFAYNALPLSR